MLDEGPNKELDGVLNEVLDRASDGEGAVDEMDVC